MLAMLLPLIFAYEIGSRLYLGESAAVQTIRAHSMLVGFFQDLGFAGRTLPSIAIAGSLLAWHIVEGKRWSLRPSVPVGMMAESLALTMPLVVFFALAQLIMGSPARPAVQMETTQDLVGLPWRAGLVVAIGAGLYEEFLFRLIGVSALRLVLVDLGRMSKRAGTAAAVATAAFAFTVYHDTTGTNGEIDIWKAGSFLAAGLYFGWVFATRGFGVAVGVHVLYDVCALMLAGRGQA